MNGIESCRKSTTAGFVNDSVLVIQGHLRSSIFGALNPFLGQLLRLFGYKSLLVLILFGNLHAAELLDLEKGAQSFVLETKRIEIPGFPYAFNPAIVRWQGRLLMSFRVIPERKQSFNSEIGLVWLNEEFDPISTPQLLSLREEDSTVPCRAEDARLIVVGEKLYIVYDDNEEEKISKGGFRIYVSELIYDSEHFIARNVEGLFHFEGESKERREKSWVPFNYHGNLLLAYSILPHRIFFPRLDGSGHCLTIEETRGDIQWDFGELRGGTPGILDGWEYLAFFHSTKKMATIHSNGKPTLHYFLGAYTFSSSPPFEITQISPEPIVGENFYHGIPYTPYWHPVQAIFPCGYISDENYIWIAYGRQDHECWIVKLEKNGLLQSLIPVRSE